MEQGDFESLVSRMERLAREKPKPYRRRVFLLAALGYAYLVVVVLILSGLVAAAIASIATIGILGGKLAAVVAVLLIAVVRGLWVRLEPPSGEGVTRADAPELFRLLTALRVRLNTAPIHVVLITPAFTAGVAQVPRLGLFGWHRNYLVLGLPLMKALSVEQFKSVLAHEMGHLSHGHARASNWIYRMRIIWARLEAIFEYRRQWGSGLIRAFFKWYIPYFNAVSFPFARANEFQADAASVRVTSARMAGQALTGVHIIGIYLAHRYWPAMIAASKDPATRTVAPFAGFVAQTVRSVPDAELQSWVAAALKHVTSHDDTHPSLADRLKAMGAAAEFAPPALGEGAEKLLGSTLPRLEKNFDAAWNRLAARENKSHFAEAPRR
jgi:Zn-dependent protease with chaperone function